MQSQQAHDPIEGSGRTYKPRDPPSTLLHQVVREHLDAFLSYTRECKHEFFVAWSCKVRGVCPSCSGRRMAAQAAHVVDKVFPNVPVRQWVLSLPYELRLLMAKRSDVLSAVLQIVMRVVVGRYVSRARELGIDNPKAGGINVLQRFGGALNFDLCGRSARG